MLNSYYTKKLVGIQEVKVKNIRENEYSFEIEIKQPRKKCICPWCGERTDKIHDYRMVGFLYDIIEPIVFIIILYILAVVNHFDNFTQ